MVYVIGWQYINSDFHVALSAGLVVADVAHDEAHVHVVVEETGRHCNSFFSGDGLLCGPVPTDRPYPGEIVCGRSTHHEYEVGYQWVD